MKIFVTGGTGFIGSHFLNAALAAGHEVTAVRRPGGQTRIALTSQPRWLDLASMQDVTEKDLEGCDSFVHLAAAGVNPQENAWNHLFQINVADSLDLWLKAAIAGVKRFVICGSCFEYGKSGERYDFIPVDAPLEPTAPYHASKAAASLAAMALAVEKKLQMSILRPFHVFGEGEDEGRFWPALRSAALAGKDFPMTGGDQIRDFVPVTDVARELLSATANTPLLPGVPQIRNLGTGSPQSLKDFATHWWQAFGATGQLRLGEVPYRPNEVMRYVPEIDNQKRQYQS